MLKSQCLSFSEGDIHHIMHMRADFSHCMAKNRDHLAVIGRSNHTAILWPQPQTLTPTPLHYSDSCSSWPLCRLVQGIIIIGVTPATCAQGRLVSAHQLRCMREQFDQRADSAAAEGGGAGGGPARSSAFRSAVVALHGYAGTAVSGRNRALVLL